MEQPVLNTPTPTAEHAKEANRIASAWIDNGFATPEKLVDRIALALALRDERLATLEGENAKLKAALAETWREIEIWICYCRGLEQCAFMVEITSLRDHIARVVPLITEAYNASEWKPQQALTDTLTQTPGDTNNG
jgi:hypothetical protein